MLDRLHHIAFVVRDLDAAVAHYARLFGRPVSERGPVSARGAEVAVFRLANVLIEFVSPTDANGPLQRHVDAHGEGFFHLGFATPDLEGTMSALAARGFATGAIRNNYSDWRIAYLTDQASPLITAHLVDKDLRD